MSFRARRSTVPLLAALALALAAAPAAAHAGGWLYVTEQTASLGLVQPLSIGADASISALASSPPTVGFEPRTVAVTPDGAHVYVPVTGSLFQFGATATGLAAFDPPSVLTAPGATSLVVAPDGGTAYLAVEDAVEWFHVGADGTLTSDPDDTVDATGAEALAMTPDGRHLYALGSTSIDAFDVGADGQLTAASPSSVTLGGRFASALAVTPDGRSLYVALDALGTDDATTPAIGQYDIGADGTLTPKSPELVDLPEGAQPHALAVAPDGGHLYVADQHLGIDQLAVGPGGALALMSPASAGSAAAIDLVVSPDGRSVYATTPTSSDTTRRFAVEPDGTLSTTSDVAQTGLGSGALAISPDQGPRAAFTVATAAAGSATSFDGGGSTDSDGSVARYDWSFGDGGSDSTTTPQTTHTYPQPGTYTVTLTVTDDDGASTTRVFTGQQVLRNGSAVATASQPVVVPATPPAGGGGGGEDAGTSIAASATTLRVPRLTKLKIAPARFRVGPASKRAAIAKKAPSLKTKRAARAKAGATVSFHLDVRGSVRVTVAQQRAGRETGKRREAACKVGARRGARCARWVSLEGADTLKSRPAGTTKLAFSGHFKHRALNPGRYRLTLTPSSGKHNGKPVSVAFTIVR